MNNGYYQTGGNHRTDSEGFTGLALPPQEKDPDDTLIVIFSQEAFRNNFASDKAGRDIAEIKDCISIRAPGCKDPLYEGPIRPADFKRPSFKRRYDAWKATAENKVSGTPLESWAYLNVAQRYELRALGITTVDELANVPDSSFSRLGMGAMTLVKKAKDFIAAAAGQAPFLELREEHEKLKIRNADLEKQFLAMKAQFDVMCSGQVGMAQLQQPRIPLSALDFPTAPVREVSFEPQIAMPTREPKKKKGWPKGKPRKSKEK